MRVALTLKAPQRAVITVRLPSGASVLEITPADALEVLPPVDDAGTLSPLRLAAGKAAVVTYSVSPPWSASSPSRESPPLDAGWSWADLSDLAAGLGGVVRLGRVTIAAEPAEDGSPTGPAAYVAGDLLSGRGVLIVGPAVGLRGWRLWVGEKPVDVYVPGGSNQKNDPPRGLVELARLCRAYGLGARDHLTLFDPTGDPVELAARYWRSLFPWDLGPDQAGWVRGFALYSLASVEAGVDDERAESYLQSLGATTDQPLPGGPTPDQPSPGHGEALFLALGLELRQRTAGVVGLNDLLDYISLYGPGEHLDGPALSLTTIGLTGRDFTDWFQGRLITDGPPAAQPAIPSDFIAREMAYLRQAATPTGGTAAKPASDRPVPFAAVAPGAARPAPEGRKVVYLTFDDGPSAVTPQVLKTLEDYGVNATFFVIGVNVRRYPNLVKRMAEDGDAIGNHTFDHDQSTVYASPAAFLASVKKAESVISGVTGSAPAIVRAPGGTSGHFTPEYYPVLADNGYTVYNWDVSSADTDASKPDAAAIAENVIGAVKGRRTAIVLMHDSAGHASTAEALPVIIQALLEAGYELATLGPK